MSVIAALLAARGRGPRPPASDASSGRRAALPLLVLLAAAATFLCAPVLAHAAAPPEVVSSSAANVSADSADLLAEINPQGEATSYHFEYGTTTGYGAETTSAPLGAGEATLSVAQHLQGLAATTTYHYRVVAESTLGIVPGPDHTFTTQLAGGTFTLPDDRAWELVTPPDKRGAGIRPTPFEGGLVQASQSGDGLIYVASSPVTEAAEGNRSEEVVQTLARRSAAGWSSQVLTSPNASLGQYVEGASTEYKAFSPDLGTALLEPRGTTPLPPLTAGAERTIYLRDSLSGVFTPLVTSKNVKPGETISPGEGESPEIEGASPDLSHVVLGSGRALTPEVSSPTALENLYEWHEGRLQLVSVLPDGRPASEAFEEHPSQLAELGSQNVITRNAVSTDGSRVIWEASQGNAHLYLRDLAAGETVQLDEVQGVPFSSESVPRFQGASTDGSRVFFTDSERLTPGSHANPNEPDLYVAEVSLGAPLAVTVTDLTANPEAAHVRGTILGYSEDGSIVYYVAQAQLAPGAPPGPTLYVQRYEGGAWGSPQVVAALSEGDEPDWNGAGNALQTARVSPDGRYLAFMSQRSITGYDSRDLLSGEADEEVYLYRAATGGVRCVSCNPTGARPRGLQVPPENTTLEKPLVDLPKIWHGRGLAASVPTWSRPSETQGTYQPRYLSDSGRVYFDAADGLVPADGNGTEDVYQYEPDGSPGATCGPASQSASQVYVREVETGAEPVASPGVASGCISLLSSGTSSEESIFLDASENGEDVFILTSSQLSPVDSDSGYDIYDAHVCSATVPCPEISVTAPPCTAAESCRGSARAALPVEGEAASAALIGPGNPRQRSTAKRARKRKLALEQCRKSNERRKRVSCEQRVKRKYATHPKGTSRGRGK